MQINTNKNTLRLTSTERKQLGTALKLLMAIAKHATDSDCEQHAETAANELSMALECLDEPADVSQ